jgi:hypothetical protein
LAHASLRDEKIAHVTAHEKFVTTANARKQPPNGPRRAMLSSCWSRDGMLERRFARGASARPRAVASPFDLSSIFGRTVFRRSFLSYVIGFIGAP